MTPRSQRRNADRRACDTDLAAGGASGHTDEERLSDNVVVVAAVPQMCFSVTGHACNVPFEAVSSYIYAMARRCCLLLWHYIVRGACSLRSATYCIGV